MDEPLTIEYILKLYGDHQKQMLRDLLGDRLIASPFVAPGNAYAIALDVDRPVRRVEGNVEQAAEILRAGGKLVVSKEWLDG